jgi:HK97 family phage major capsid protein
VKSNYRALLAERADLLTQEAGARAKHGSKISDDGPFAELAAITSRRADVDAAIAREEARRADELGAAAAGESGMDPVGPGERALYRSQDQQDGPAAYRLAQRTDGPAGRRYVDLFGAPRAAAADGWGSFNEFLATVHSGISHPGLQQVAASMGETVGSAGGFAVPDEFTARLLDESLEDEIVRPRARIEPMRFESKKVARFDGYDHSSNLYGGLLGVWLAEAGTATDQDAKLELQTLNAHKLGIFARASNELAEDGTSFEEQLGQAMVKATGWSLDYAFLNGNGAGKPKGVLQSNSLVVVAKEVGQGADTIVYENLVKMFARISPASVSKSVWVANNTAIPQLLTLSIIVGAGGAPVPVLSESNGQFRMLTRPVLFTEKVPVLGDQGDLSLIDFSQYTVGLRREATLEKSIHVGWQNDTAGYRTILRADGQASWSKAMTPKHGSSLSWAVTLAARA